LKDEEPDSREPEESTWEPPSEGVANAQMMGLKSFLSKFGASPLGMGGRIPTELREAIKWAEAEKEKRGMSGR
jgi:hypothetical protein